MNIFDTLGIDETSFEWQDLAICRGMPIRMFYEGYENDEQIAKVVDAACLSCPVMAQCMQSAIDNKEYGCWGGIYWNAGVKDDNRNSHKTPETWKKIKEKLSG